MSLEGTGLLRKYIVNSFPRPESFLAVLAVFNFLPVLLVGGSGESWSNNFLTCSRSSKETHLQGREKSEEKKEAERREKQ